LIPSGKFDKSLPLLFWLPSYLWSSFATKKILDPESGPHNTLVFLLFCSQSMVEIHFNVLPKIQGRS